MMTFGRIGLSPNAQFTATWGWRMEACGQSQTRSEKDAREKSPLMAGWSWNSCRSRHLKQEHQNENVRNPDHAWPGRFSGFSTQWFATAPRGKCPALDNS